MKRNRFECVMSPEVAATLSALAARRRSSRAAVIREALGLLATADRRPADSYLGITEDRECLDIVLMGARE